jgi:arylsulfatase
MYNTAKCYPTRVCLLTGLYFQQSDREFNRTATIGEVLRPAGYRTWWSGKHHARFNPYERGFDHFSGFLGGAINFWNPGDQARPGEPPPAGRSVYTWAFDDELVKPFMPDRDFYSTDAFTDWALEWLDETDEDTPFFLYIAYNAPHWPLHAWSEDIAKYRGVYDRGYEVVRNTRYRRQVDMGLFDANTAPLSEPEYASDGGWDDLSADEQQHEAQRMEIHAAMVDRVDQNVGRLVARLRQTGRLDNTLILFLADNGASPERPKVQHDPEAAWGSVGSFESIGRSWATVANTPLRKWKTSSYEGGIDTPMIAHWPEGIVSPGRICRDPYHLIDVMPTLVQLTGATYPGKLNGQVIPPMQGVSLLPSLQDEPIGAGYREKPIFWQFGKGKAVRRGKWKLVSGRSPWQLYDMSSDRTETRDLAEEHPETAKALAAQWDTWAREMRIDLSD